MHANKKILANIGGVLLLFLLLIIPIESINAQRMGHRASRGGGRSMSSRPSPQRQAQPRHNTQRPSTQRPSTQQRSNPSRSINGGHNKSNNRSKQATPNTRQRDRSKTSDRAASGTDRRNKASDGNRRTSDVRTRDGNRSNTRNSGNRNNNNRNINIDNSRNININNTRVRAGTRVYVRPPYRWGGYAYRTHFAFYWHPYRPFYWGPAWHPWGWWVATIATTAIIIELNNQTYHCDHGTYYVEKDDGYEVVQAPVGATVESLPEETEVVQVNETTNNYYYGGAYYEKSELGYTVVPATAGTIVPHLPEGGEEVKVGDITMIQFGETYYMPIQVDGEDMYEIVDVSEDETAE